MTLTLLLISFLTKYFALKTNSLLPRQWGWWSSIAIIDKVSLIFTFKSFIMYIVSLISKFKALDSDELRLYVLTMEFLRLLRTTIHIHEIVFIGSSPRRRCYKCEITKMDDTHSGSNVHLFIRSIMYTLWGLQEGTSYYTTILHS